MSTRSVQTISRSQTVMQRMGLSRAVPRIAAKPALAARPRVPAPPLAVREEGAPGHMVRSP
eukprot:13830123-Alexandrium_andersonii.AAC.1